MSEFAQIGGDRPVGFALCGQEFVFRGVAPKKYQEWLNDTSRTEGDEEGGTTWESLCERADELVLLGLREEDHERYRKLRDGDLNGATVPTPSEIISLRNWIMEVETGRPPQSATPSSDGRTESTEASSTEESSQREEILVA